MIKDMSFIVFKYKVIPFFMKYNQEKMKIVHGPISGAALVVLAEV